MDRQFCHQFKRFVIDIQKFDELDKLILDHIGEYRIRVSPAFLTMRMTVAQLSFLVPAGEPCAQTLVVLAERNRVAVRAVQKLRQREDVCLRRCPDRPSGQAAFLVHGRNVFQKVEIKDGSSRIMQHVGCVLLLMRDQFLGAAVTDQTRIRTPVRNHPPYIIRIDRARLPPAIPKMVAIRHDCLSDPFVSNAAIAIQTQDAFGAFKITAPERLLMRRFGFILTRDNRAVGHQPRPL